MQNHFELFHLPQRFAVDMKALESAYREHAEAIEDAGKTVDGRGGLHLN